MRKVQFTVHSKGSHTEQIFVQQGGRDVELLRLSSPSPRRAVRVLHSLLIRHDGTRSMVGHGEGLRRSMVGHGEFFRRSREGHGEFFRRSMVGHGESSGGQGSAIVSVHGGPWWVFSLVQGGPG